MTRSGPRNPNIVRNLDGVRYKWRLGGGQCWSLRVLQLCWLASIGAAVHSIALLVLQFLHGGVHLGASDVVDAKTLKRDS